MRETKKFYEEHLNFSLRNALEYYISPGIRCKFDIIHKMVKNNKNFHNCIDLGSSGNSILKFFNGECKSHKIFVDIAVKPLINYIDFNSKRIKRNSKKRAHKSYNRSINHPICADLVNLPFREGTFDFVSALDVLEHIKHDNYAIKEISRISKNHSLIVITVPHKRKYYSDQDRLIGHYRRYETKELIKKFFENNMICSRKFGIYGFLMRISFLQARNPEAVEKGLISLRNIYIENIFFRKIWDLIVLFLSFLMKLDARIQGIKKSMNIGFFFSKN